MQNFKKLRSESAFLQWSLVITKNVYLKKYAKKIKELNLGHDEIMYLKEKEESHNPSSHNPSSAQNELQDAILEGLKKLPQLWQFVFNLREIEGYSYKEIANIANIRIGTVKSILNRSKNKLREFLKNREHFES